MLKYTEKFKEAVVLDYLNGTMGYRRLSAHHGTTAEDIKRWVAAYRLHGLAGLSRKAAHYKAQFKLSILQHMWENGLSYKKTAAVFNTHPSSVATWESRYRTGGMEGLDRPNSHARQMKKPSTKPDKPDAERTRDELLKENEYLRMEVEVLKKLQALVQAQKLAATKKRK